MDNDDEISRLPRDLLASILSLLTFKEAMVTSVLSRRWKKVWTFYHGYMDFEVSKKLRRGGCSNYARLVDKVIDTLEQVESGGVLDSFTIRFKLCPENLTSVDRWVRFALEKRTVKSLIFKTELSFIPSGCSHCFLAYDFPPLRCFNSRQHNNLRALTYIQFIDVNVSGETIGHFLSNCPLLQSLCLKNSRKPLIHLRVSGETLALRHLFIISCPDLTTVELSAPNLASLVYRSVEKTKVEFDVRSVPKLVEFTIGLWSICPNVTALALCLFTCFSCLQKLELDIYCKEPADLTKLTELKLTSVKRLTMRFNWYGRQSILAWLPLLRAFPDLQKFTLKMGSRWDDNDRIDGLTGWHETFPNEHLKVFKVVGFGDSSYDIELVTRFVEKIATLEKIVLVCDEEKAATRFETELIIPEEEQITSRNNIGANLDHCHPNNIEANLDRTYDYCESLALLDGYDDPTIS